MFFYPLGRRCGLCLILAIFVAALPGCGPPAAHVQGQATHNGAPVADADVMLIAADDAKQQFFGKTDKDGQIYVSYGDQKGAPPGRYEIRITHTTLRDGKALPAGEEGAVLRDSNRAVSRTYVFEQQLDAGAVTLDLKLEAARLEPIERRE